MRQTCAHAHSILLILKHFHKSSQRHFLCQDSGRVLSKVERVLRISLIRYRTPFNPCICIQETAILLSDQSGGKSSFHKKTTDCSAAALNFTLIESDMMYG